LEETDAPLGIVPVKAPRCNAHSLDISTRAIGAQCKLRCQLLRIGEPGAGILIALVSIVIVRLEMVTVALHLRRGSSVRLTSEGMDQTLSG